MPVGIRLYDKPRQNRSAALLTTAWSENMTRAIDVAAIEIEFVELAGDGPDADVFGYDCLGGLRIEGRRRNNVVTIKRT